MSWLLINKKRLAWFFQGPAEQFWGALLLNKWPTPGPVVFPLNIYFKCAACVRQRLIRSLWARTNKGKRPTQPSGGLEFCPCPSSQLPLGSFQLEAGYLQDIMGVRPRLQEAELTAAAPKRSFKLLAVLDPAGPNASGSGWGRQLFSGPPALGNRMTQWSGRRPGSQAASSTGKPCGEPVSCEVLGAGLSCQPGPPRLSPCWGRCGMCLLCSWPPQSRAGEGNKHPMAL